MNEVIINILSLIVAIVCCWWGWVFYSVVAIQKTNNNRVAVIASTVGASLHVLAMVFITLNFR